MQANNNNANGKDISSLLFEEYQNYREETIYNRRFNHQDLVSILEKLALDSKFLVKKVGNSAEGRSINLIKIGKGKLKVMLWSQMHGDESTGTAALLDIMNFLKREDELDELRNEILENITIYALPMINPDGAQAFSRSNSFGVDINRDAISCISPEAKILHNVFTSIQPDFAINLHDLCAHHKVGNSLKTTALALLAPPADELLTTTESMEKAMKVASSINATLQEFIPGKIALYPACFDKRCFGETFQKLGASTLLLESGWVANDPEKQYIRKITFIAILEALASIADKSFETESVEAYKAIPQDNPNAFDVLIRNAYVFSNGEKYKVDIAINREEKTIKEGNNTFFYTLSEIKEIGDLSEASALEEYSADDMVATPGKIFPEVYKTIHELKDLDLDVLKQMADLGYTTLRLNQLPYGRDFSKIPLHLVTRYADVDNEIKIGNRPNFLLQRNGKTIFAIINGNVLEL